MTQERVNNNSNYAFVLEDPSKPRKYQLNFNLGSEYVKDLKHIPVTAMDHHNPQQQRHADLLPNRQPASSITLPPIRELILPPISINHHQQSHPHVQQESIPLASRPHLPPLQHSFDPPQNPSPYNYQTSINDRVNDNHNQFSPDVAHYHPHHGYPTATNGNHHYQHPSVSHHPQVSQVSQVPHLPQVSPHHHQTYQSQQPPLPHLYQQPLPQNSNHVHLQQQQHLHHHHPSHQSHLHNNEIIPERNQHDHQPSVSVGYNSLSRQPYYSQISNDNSSSQMITSQSLNMVTPPHDHQMSNIRNIQNIPNIQTNDSYPVHHQLQQRQLPPQQQQQQRVSTSVPHNNMDRHYPDSIAHEQQLHNNYSPQPIQQMYKKHQAPLMDLLNSSHQTPPLNPVSPPKSLHLQPSQQQPIMQYPHENRETSPFYLAPPSHHQSGSNSSVSTRSSSPAPSTPVTSFSSHNSPNNSLSQFVEKPNDQNLPLKKRGGRSQKHPRPIVPAGPLPVQQPVTAPTQSQSQSNVTNDTPVFVPYVVPNTNPIPDIGSQSNISKSTTRPQKNSLTTASGVLPSSQKRTRKPKDASVSKDLIHEDKKSRSINRPSSEIHSEINSEIPSECSSADISIQNLKRDYSCVPGSQIIESDNNKRYKPSQEIIDDSTMMNGVTESKDENIETALILNSLKNNIIEKPISNIDIMNVDMNNVDIDTKNIDTKNIDTKDVDMKDIDMKDVEMNVDKNIINNNNVDMNIINNNNVDTNIMNKNIVINKNLISNNDINVNTNESMDGQKLATKVRQLSIHEEIPVKEENDDGPQMKSPIISRSFHSSKRHHKKSALDIDKRVCDDNSADNRVVKNIVHIKQEHVPIDNADNDSDNDLAMDDGSDDDEFSKRKQPKRDNEFENNVQWNSDDMETEEEVEEEVEIYQTTSSIGGKDDNRKQTVVYTSSPPSSTSLLGIKRVKVEDVKDTFIITATTTTKPTFPVSPNTNGSGTMSRKASTSSSISRKGSTSSNGSNKDAASNTPCSDVSDTLSTSTSIPPANINGNGSVRSQRPYPARRRSTMRDDEKLELDAIEWEKNIEIPHHIWDETLRVFEIVKHSKEMKNRQPHRKRNHILASILFILCRQNGLPRTFVEICNAASIRKQEIGTYYRLMLKVFESNGLGGGSNGTVDSAEYLKRWCQNLKLPSHILDAAIHVYRQASELNITTGKCPVSVGAASIWLSIASWNEIRATHWSVNDDQEQIRCEHKDVAAAAGVVNATLVGCFKNLSKYKDKLLPPDFLIEAKTRLPDLHKKSDIIETNSNNDIEDGSIENKKNTHAPLLSNTIISSPPPIDDIVDNYKEKEPIKSEQTPIKSEQTPIKSEQIPIKSEQIPIKSEPNSPDSSELASKIKTEPLNSKDNYSEKASSLVKLVTKMIESEVSEPQDDADDELEEGELREEDNKIIE